MHAEHIVGLTARERFSDTIAQAAAIRFAAIKADGVLRPYNADRPVGAQGNIFELDHLAGDSACVFLSVGARYREYIEPDAAYGFVFDARHLILEHGAIVGVDMLQHYEDLLEQCIAEVAATLPPLLMITDAELADFAALAGDDPAMLAYVREQSIYRDGDIDMAIRIGDMTEPGAQEAVALFKQRVPALQATHRCAGKAALAALREGVEILVPGALALGCAIGTIEAGKVVIL
jgi:hypothetical protein